MSKSLVKDPLTKLVPADGLGIFRIGFGLLLAMEFWYLLQSGDLERLYLHPEKLFKYPGFSWVVPLDVTGMYVLGWIGFIGSLLFAFGIWKKTGVVVTLFTWSWLFCLDASNYYNHHYLVLLLLIWFVIVPFVSVLTLEPGRYSWRVPQGYQLSLQALFGIVYLFAALAKINSYWMSGYPLRILFSNGEDWGLPGVVWTWFGASDQIGIAVSWIGLSIDLLAFPALVWSRSRRIAIVVLLLFHLSIGMVFGIGIFPPLMILSLVLFMDQERLATFINRLIGVGQVREARGSRTTAWLIGGLVCLHLVVPTRSFHHIDTIAITREGHRFSWRMMLHSYTPRWKAWHINRHGKKEEISTLALLTKRQRYNIGAQPDLLAQLVRYLERKHPESKQVWIESDVTINGVDRYSLHIDQDGIHKSKIY